MDPREQVIIGWQSRRTYVWSPGGGAGGPVRFPFRSRRAVSIHTETGRWSLRSPRPHQWPMITTPATTQHHPNRASSAGATKTRGKLPIISPSPAHQQPHALCDRLTHPPKAQTSALLPPWVYARPISSSRPITSPSASRSRRLASASCSCVCVALAAMSQYLL